MCGVEEAVYTAIIVVLFAAFLIFACRPRKPIQITVPNFSMRDMPSVLDSESEHDASSPLSRTHTFQDTELNSQPDHGDSSTSVSPRSSPENS